MDPDEVAELCQDFFTDLMGDEQFWAGGGEAVAASPVFRLLDVEVDDDVIRLLVEPRDGLDQDDDRIAESLDRAIAALSETHEELTDYRISYRFDED